jgi:hypothetical protein
MRPTLLALLVACATTTTSAPIHGGPRGLRASEHLDAAAQQDALARQQAAWPDHSMVATPGGVDQPIAMPWYRSWNTAGEHERLAAEHRSNAAALQEAYEQACGTHSDAGMSPLARYGIGGWPTKDGAVVYLSKDAGPPDTLLAALHCHRAWMMLGPSDMDDCPLDLPGLAVDARGDEGGVTLVLTIADPALIPELQRRTARDLEKGHAEPH